jgi:acetyl esterase/lipase
MRPVRSKALLAALALALPALEAPALEPTHKDVVYAIVDGQPLRLDLYLSGIGEPCPLVLWVHGGGWVSGDYYPVDDFLARAVLERGMALASAEYRLTLEARFPSRTFPAQIHDVKGAVRFLKAHAAEYGLDPQRFGVWGASAGGHLAALLGASGNAPPLEGSVGGNLDQSSNVRAVVDYFGPARMETFAVQDPWVAEPLGPLSLLFGHPMADILAHWEDPAPPYPDLVALAISAGPYHHADSADPDFFIAHGEADDVVSVEQSDELASRLGEAGVPYTYVRVPGAGHDGAAMPGEEALAFLWDALAAPLLAADFAYSPAAPTDAEVVTFSASATGGRPPYAFAWDLAGTPASGSEAAKAFEPGEHLVTLTARDGTDAESVAVQSLQVGRSVFVTAVRALASPFRLKVSGAGFEEGCSVRVGGAAAPRSVYRGPGEVVAKGSGLKAMVPKGVSVEISVESPDGRRSAPFLFTR